MSDLPSAMQGYSLGSEEDLLVQLPPPPDLTDAVGAWLKQRFPLQLHPVDATMAEIQRYLGHQDVVDTVLQAIEHLNNPCADPPQS